MPTRVHPPAEVGQRFGDRIVTEILPRDYTANERVAWRCKCGARGETYTYNLRKHLWCGHSAGRRPRLPVHQSKPRPRNQPPFIFERLPSGEIVKRRVP